MKYTIPFNKALYYGDEEKYVFQAIESRQLSGDGKFNRRCEAWFESKLGCARALLTPSCTHALEMASILINVEPGDEIIMPSYTFVSTANAFVLRGAKIVFVDIRPDTMNIDEHLIESAITKKTKAIVPVHYGGIGCDMKTIMNVAERHDLYVIEDAAQGMMSTYDGKPLGTFGHLSTFSFHETKNYTSGGEGGLLIINDNEFIERAEIVREKGTNRSKYFRGMVDKYSWVDIGSSFLLSEIQAAYLWGQLKNSTKINLCRLSIWDKYYSELQELENPKKIELARIPPYCKGNGHMFFIKCKDKVEREKLIGHMKSQGILSVFHYIPLHSSHAGKQYGYFSGTDKFTTLHSERILRLPIYYGMKQHESDAVIASIKGFYC